MSLKIDWDDISLISNDIKLIRENPDKINWSLLSLNKNVIEVLEENPDNIDWYNLSENPNAINFLKKIKRKLNGDIYQEIRIQ